MNNYKDYLIKRIEEKFKNHIAEIKEIEGTQIVFWHEPGTIIYSMNIIYNKRFIHISGDIGEAIYKTTWDTNYKNCSDVDFYYLLEKLSCSKFKETNWDANNCLEDIENWYNEKRTIALELEKPKSYIKDLELFKKRLDESAYTELEYQEFLQNSELYYFEDASESKLFEAGERLDDRFYYYWVALRMINEYLEKQNDNI